MYIRAKSITVFGVSFRSTLESCWALFFQKLQIPWLYEPTRFSFSGKVYIPDFCISPTYSLNNVLWIEIKPLRERAFVTQKYDEFQKLSKDILGHKYQILYGTPLDHVTTINIDYPGEPRPFSQLNSKLVDLSAEYSFPENVHIYKSKITRALRILKQKSGTVVLRKSVQDLSALCNNMPGCWEAQDLLKRSQKLLKLRTGERGSNYTNEIIKAWN